MPKQIVVFAMLPSGNIAYASDRNENDEFTYTFALAEAAIYNWQADAMNAVRDRVSEQAEYLHPSAGMKPLPIMTAWDYRQLTEAEATARHANAA